MPLALALTATNHCFVSPLLSCILQPLIECKNWDTHFLSHRATRGSHGLKESKGFTHTVINTIKTATTWFDNPLDYVNPLPVTFYRHTIRSKNLKGSSKL